MGADRRAFAVVSMEITEGAGEFSEQNPAGTKREVAIYGDF